MSVVECYVSVTGEMEYVKSLIHSVFDGVVPMYTYNEALYTVECEEGYIEFHVNHSKFSMDRCDLFVGDPQSCDHIQDHTKIVTHDSVLGENWRYLYDIIKGRHPEVCHTVVVKTDSDRIQIIADLTRSFSKLITSISVGYDTEAAREMMSAIQKYIGKA